MTKEEVLEAIKKEGEAAGTLFIVEPIMIKVHDLIEHTIGMDRRHIYHRHGKAFYKPYRNYFDAGKEEPVFEALVDLGYATRHRDYWYMMTRAGLDWFGNWISVHIHDEED